MEKNSINNSNNAEKFPRKISDKEKYYLFSVLPENKQGYKKYRDKIEDLYVTGYGRFGKNNLILGEKNSKPDPGFPSSSAFAIGTVKFSETEVDIIIHEEISDEIEFDISSSVTENVPDPGNEILKWNYSEWTPGNKAPKDGSYVREVVIKKDEFILGIAPGHKKIWLYDFKDGVNHILPVSNFYNYLMIVRNIRDKKIVLKPNLLFENVGDYKDDEIISAFILYNKYFRKVEMETPEEFTIKKKKSFLNFF